MDKDFLNIVRQTEDALKESKDDWQKAFLGYAEEVALRLDNYKKKGDEIKKCIGKYKLNEVQLYTSVTLVKKSNRKVVYYDLRFCGQHICSIDVSGNAEPQLHFRKGDKEKNKEWLNIEKDFESNAIDISSPEAKMFFEELAAGKGTTQSPEHKLESLLLRELAVEEGERKVEGLKFIRPIMLGKGFFQMPTPLKGSSHKPIISIRKDGAASGGGIDILARMATPQTKNNWSLSVIELKDENKESELVKKVMIQALIYATFIAYLLADEKCGEAWYNIFRDQKDPAKLPESIDILVIAMMPPNEDSTKDDIDGGVIELEICGRTINLRPYTAFIEHNKDVTEITKTSGTYLEIKRKSK